MSQCPFCGKKIAMSKAFCSKTCKENYFQLIAIQIPDIFVKRLYQLNSSQDVIDNKITDFAVKNKWRHDLVKGKVEDMAEKFGYLQRAEQ